MNLFTRSKESVAMPADTAIQVKEIETGHAFENKKTRIFVVTGGLADVWKAQADKLVPSPGDKHPDDAAFGCVAQRSNPRNGEVLVTFEYQKV